MLQYVHYIYFNLIPLNPESSAPSSDEASASSQMKMNFSSLRLSASWQAFQLLANLNESSQNLCTILCRMKLTFEEEEKLLLIERPVLVGDMVPVPSSLSPCPKSLVEFSFRGDFCQSHPWLA